MINVEPISESTVSEPPAGKLPAGSGEIPVELEYAGRGKRKPMELGDQEDAF